MRRVWAPSPLAERGETGSLRLAGYCEEVSLLKVLMVLARESWRILWKRRRGLASAWDSVFLAPESRLDHSQAHLRCGNVIWIVSNPETANLSSVE